MISQYLRALSIVGLFLSPAIQADEAKPTANLISPKMQIVEAAKSVAFKGLITDKNNLKSIALASYQQTSSQKIIIEKPGASFIKVHFSKLLIPQDSHIEVKNSDASQVHRYGNATPSLFTLRDGDNGTNSFFALTIFGDTAIIELISPTELSNAAALPQPYHIEIDSFMQGFSESEIDQTIYNQQSFDIEPQSSCGVTERPDAQCWADTHPTEFERSRPVARLLINGSGSCTAWRVGSDNRMFTNNHCISGAAGPSKTEVWFNYQKSACGGGSTSGTVIVTGDQLLSTNSDLDYTLFTVKNFAEIESFGHYGLDVRNPIEQERIYIPQHGRGQPKQLAIESDKNSDGLCRVDVTLADGSAPNTDMGYMCDTIGGSSGSPVLAASSNNVLALHHFGGCPNQGVLINRIWPQVTEYFNNQIPVGDNGEPSNDPVASFNYSTNVLQVSFTDTSSDSDGTIVYRQWDFGDGTNSNLQDPTHIYSSAGDYQVSLTVNDNDGNVSTNSQIISLTNDNNGQLLKGVAVSNLSAPINQELAFYFDVPEQARSVSFKMSKGSGDADLYIKFGEKPTENSYDCRPYIGGNSETCSFSSAEVGRYYVMIKAYRAFSDVEIIADYTEGNPDAIRFEETNLSDSSGNWKHYSLDVPANMVKLVGQISGGSGDADLYLRFGSEATSSSYDCRPYKSGNNESCNITNPQAGTWYFSIRAYGSYSGLTLSGEAN